MLAPLRAALAGAPGAALADIGGGTGNYALALAAEGWNPLVVDRSPEMLARAHDKGLQTVMANARSLPFADQSFDAAMLVSMLHHVDVPAEALAEARRILRPGGRLAVMMFTREDIGDVWCLDYFPSSRTWMLETHPPLAEILVQLPGGKRLEVRYDDLVDGSLAALLAHPRVLLEAGRREQTSYFERMQRDHAEELEQGLARLAADLDAGRGPTRPGRASVIAWGKPC